jgi:large subunit ribosomal protein L25
MSATLAAQARQTGTKAQIKALRASGRIPAVVYGKKIASESISVDTPEFRKFLVDGNRNRLVELALPTGTTVKAFIKEIVRHKLSREVEHLDFQVVEDGDSVTYRVPLKIVGVPVGVKIGGGNLNIIKKDLKVRVAGDALIDSVDVDVSAIEKGQALFVREVAFPGGTVLTPAGQAVVTVV